MVVGFICIAVIVLSLILVYSRQPSTSVQVIGLLIVVLSIALVLRGGWLEVGALLLLTLLLSTVSVGILSAGFGSSLSVLVPLLWALLFVGMITLLWNATLKVGHDEIVLIRNLVDNRIRAVSESVQMPPMAGWEEIVARVPRSFLSTQVMVKDVPTRSTYRLPLVKAAARYQLVDPLALHANLANRSKLYGEVSKEIGAERRTAMTDHRFWEELASRQVTGTVTGMVRNTIWGHADIDSPIDAFQNREQWPQKVEQDARAALLNNGIKLVSLRIIEVEIPETSFNEEAMRARHEADAQGMRYAAILDKMLDSLRERCGQFSESQLREIIMQAIDESQDRDRTYGFFGRKKDEHAP